MVLGVQPEPDIAEAGPLEEGLPRLGAVVAQEGVLLAHAEVVADVVGGGAGVVGGPVVLGKAASKKGKTRRKLKVMAAILTIW